MSSQFRLPADAAGRDLFPAQNGNWWVYKISDENGKASDITCKVADLKQQKNGDATFKIISQFAKNNKDQKQHLNQNLQRDQETKYYERKGSCTSLSQIEIAGKKPQKTFFTPAKIVIDSQIKPGCMFQWNAKSAEAEKLSERWQVFPNEMVKVPAGSFNCVKVGGLLIDHSLMTYQMRWYAPDVGLVKLVDRQGSKKITGELKALHLN